MIQNVLGIDVASKKLNLHLCGSQIKSCDTEIENSVSAIQDFLETKNITPKNCLVGCESTGRYHITCMEFFVKKGYRFNLLNPILTNKKIKTSIRNKKTDITDARFIASLLMQGEGTGISEENLDLTKRTLLRTRKTIVDKTTTIKIVKADLEKLNENPKLKTAIKSLEHLIEEMEKCSKEIESEVLKKEEISEDEKNLQTIPGIGKILGGVIAEEIGDINKFQNANALKAYAGLDPRVNQSGGYLRTGRITKRGNKYLRYALYMAAQVSRCHDPELKAFYESLIGRGKLTRVAIVAVAGKLCARIYAVMKNNRPYQVRPVSFS